MTQRDLNRAVARATGESVDTIEQMGFGPLDESAGDPGPNTIDWDADDDARLAMRSVRRSRLTAVA
jgi:DUF438 domain-containing protein